MRRVIITRIALLPVMLFLLATFTFLLRVLIPGEPASIILGEFAQPEDIARVNAQLGFDRPWWEQYFDFVFGVFRGDLGASYLTGAPVLDELLRRLGNSMVLIIPSLLLAVLIGTAVGAVGGYYRRRVAGRTAGLFITAAQGLPPFFLGILLIFLFVFTVRVFPTPIGMIGSSISPPTQVTGVMLLDALLAWRPDVIGSIAAHAVLPSVATAAFLSAYFAKTVRTGMTQALATPQVEFARACGLPERQIVRYALLAARTSVLTYIAILFGVMLSAQAIIELVFSWPGAGAWALDGILKGDLPVIQGFIVVTGVLVILTYIVLDVVVAALDPRIAY